MHSECSSKQESIRKKLPSVWQMSNVALIFFKYGSLHVHVLTGHCILPFVFDHRSNSTSFACWLSIKLPLKVDFACLFLWEHIFFKHFKFNLLLIKERERGQHSSFYLCRTCTTDMNNVAHGIVCSWQSALLQIQVFYNNTNAVNFFTHRFQLGLR